MNARFVLHVVVAVRDGELSWKTYAADSTMPHDVRGEVAGGFHVGPFAEGAEAIRHSLVLLHEVVRDGRLTL